MARNLARVGACADELRLMGLERFEVATVVERVGDGRGSLSRKVSSACGPPAIERMWSGPWGDGANCTTQCVGSDGRRWPCLRALVGRLAVTKVSRSWVGTVSSRVVMDTMSNPNLYCSRASPRVQCSGPHWTRNSSTQVERRLWRTRFGSLRANI